MVSFAVFSGISLLQDESVSAVRAKASPADIIFVNLFVKIPPSKIHISILAQQKIILNIFSKKLADGHKF